MVVGVGVEEEEEVLDQGRVEGGFCLWGISELSESISMIDMMLGGMYGVCVSNGLARLMISGV